jgi:hypothetical protein
MQGSYIEKEDSNAAIEDELPNESLGANRADPLGENLAKVAEVISVLPSVVLC